jgi:parvulin-like peptidyl-prolyl isomerase
MNEQTNENQNVTQNSNRNLKMPAFISKLPIKYIRIVFLVLALGLLVYVLKGYIVAATVNGVPISRIKVLQLSEQVQGATVLDSLVIDILTTQEAKKQGVTVTKEEIDAEMAKIEETLTQQGVTLDDTLKQRNMTKEQLVQRLTLGKLLEKMLLKNITVSDEEIAKYMEDNAKYLPENKDTPEFKEQVRQDLQQQKLGTEYQTWIQDVKSNSKINYFVTY